MSGPAGSHLRSWIFSYADLVTLLMVFFIIMVSPQAVVSEKQQDNMKKLTETVEHVKETIKSEHIEDYVKVEQNGNTAKITMKDRILFEVGQASLDAESQNKFQPIMESLFALNNTHEFSIQGHTDALPIRAGSPFKSNWHLSTERALSVLDIFIHRGFNQSKLSAQGFGEYRPLLPNQELSGKDLPENRAKNRRVEIYIK